MKKHNNDEFNRVLRLMDAAYKTQEGEFQKPRVWKSTPNASLMDALKKRKFSRKNAEFIAAILAGIDTHNKAGNVNFAIERTSMIIHERV